jgi:hypothetical protein
MSNRGRAGGIQCALIFVFVKLGDFSPFTTAQLGRNGEHILLVFGATAAQACEGFTHKCVVSNNKHVGNAKTHS